MVVMMAVVVVTRHVDTRHKMVAMVMVEVTPRMDVMVTMMAMVAVLNLRDHPGRALLDGGGDARGQRGCRFRLRRRRRDDQQAADGEQAENFSDEHQCSPSRWRVKDQHRFLADVEMRLGLDR